MADRPIPLHEHEVRGILAGRQTQVRRVLKPQPPACVDFYRGTNGEWRWEGTDDPVAISKGEIPSGAEKLPYHVGDRLWVREAHYLTDDGHEEFAVCAANSDHVAAHLARIDRMPAWFSEELLKRHKRLRPSTNMPRWASRLTLTVTDVRVQRLQEISETDARAGGLEWEAPNYGVSGTYFWNKDARKAFRALWDSINAKRPGCAWSDDPWVVAVTLTSERRNIDAGAG